MAVHIDDFETNDFTGWDGTSEDAGCTSATEATDPHCNTYNAKFSVTATANDWAYAHETFGSTYTTLYYKIEAQLLTAQPINGKRFHPLIIRGQGGTIAELAYTYDGVNYMWRLSCVDGAGVSVGTYNHTATLGTYYCLKLKVVVDGAAGECRFYLDGTERITLTSLDSDGNGNLNGYRVGEGISTGATAHEWRIDCCEVDTSDIACDPAGGLSIPVAMHQYNHHFCKIIRG